MWAMLWRVSSDEQFTQEAASHWEESHWALGEGAGDREGAVRLLPPGAGFWSLLPSRVVVGGSFGEAG